MRFITTFLSMLLLGTGAVAAPRNVTKICEAELSTLERPLISQNDPKFQNRLFTDGIVAAHYATWLMLAANGTDFPFTDSRRGEFDNTVTIARFIYDHFRKSIGVEPYQGNELAYALRRYFSAMQLGVSVQDRWMSATLAYRKLELPKPEPIKLSDRIVSGPADVQRKSHFIASREEAIRAFEENEAWVKSITMPMLAKESKKAVLLVSLMQFDDDEPHWVLVTDINPTERYVSILDPMYPQEQSVRYAISPKKFKNGNSGIWLSYRDYGDSYIADVVSITPQK